MPVAADRELTINLPRVPEKITIHKSGSNTAAIESVKADVCIDILMRKNKYLNNLAGEEPSGHQKGYATDARIQIVLERSNRHCWNRDHEHDSQGTNELSAVLTAYAAETLYCLAL